MQTMDSCGDQAVNIIQEQGAMWRRLRPRTGHQPIQTILRLLSPGRVVPAGWDYLQERQIFPGTTQQVYGLLAALAQKEASHDAKQPVFYQLRQELQSEQQEAAKQTERRRKIHVQVRELQATRQLYGVKTQQGVYCTQAKDVANAFKEFWSGIMR